MEFNLYHISTSFNYITFLALVSFILPVISFLVLILVGNENKKWAWFATGNMFINFLIAIFIFSNTFNQQTFSTQFQWVKFSNSLLPLSLGIKIDFISAAMLLIVTLISFLVHLYSKEYMHHDKQYIRYFAYLNTFTASMIGILIGDNLFAMFVFWELVGLTSYLLIGFWYQKNTAIKASKKAFLLNRIGDLGFLVGLMTLWYMFGNLNLESLYQGMKNSEISNGIWSITYTVNGYTVIKSMDAIWITIAGIGIFCGCVGKSAQFPLQIWLPDAMEGPTPISALIHAATMVAAGVYLLARVFPLLNETTLDVITFVGCISAFTGAYAAASQFDIKKILAYSTISQLGYMVMAIGVGAYQNSLFHLFTHAFFKAGLFLAVGAVIHCLHELQEKLEHQNIHIHFDPQNVILMGGLRKLLPFTYWVYFITAWSAMGLPLSSGFMSKDAIIASTLAWANIKAANGNFIYFIIPIIALFTGLVTAFYMGRQLFVVFGGKNRLENYFSQAKNAITQIEDIKPLMKIPLTVLSVLSVFIWFSFNPLSAEHSWVHNQFPKLMSVVPDFSISQDLLQLYTHQMHYYTLAFSTLCAVLGFYLSYHKFGKENNNPMSRSTNLNSYGIFKQLSVNNFYLDSLYRKTIIQFAFISSKSANWIDRKVIDKTVNNAAISTVILAHIVAMFDYYIVDGMTKLITWISKLIGNLTMQIQGGKIQNYLSWVLIGLIGFFAILLLV